MGISYRDRRSRVCWCFMVPFVALTFGLGFMAGTLYHEGTNQSPHRKMALDGSARLQQVAQQVQQQPVQQQQQVQQAQQPAVTQEVASGVAASAQDPAVKSLVVQQEKPPQQQQQQQQQQDKQQDKQAEAQQEQQKKKEQDEQIKAQQEQQKKKQQDEQAQAQQEQLKKKQQEEQMKAQQEQQDKQKQQAQAQAEKQKQEEEQKRRQQEQQKQKEEAAQQQQQAQKQEAQQQQVQKQEVQQKQQAQQQKEQQGGHQQAEAKGEKRLVMRESICTNTCPKASNGQCNDGRAPPTPGQANMVLCDLGTDCNDCGPWTPTVPPAWKDREGPIAMLLRKGVEVRVRPTAPGASQHFVYQFAYTDPQKDTAVSGDMERAQLIEPPISKIFMSIFKSGCRRPDGSRGLFVDVGSNFGWFAVMAAVLGCKVIAYEPVPHFRAFLEYNLALNDVSHLVDVRANIVSGQSGQNMKIVVPSAGIWGTASVEGANLDRHNAGKIEEFTVPSVTLDEQIKEEVLLMKVDVEGWEWSVFSGAQKMLKSLTVHNVIMEYSPGVAEHNRKPDDLIATVQILIDLIGHGFRIAHDLDVAGHDFAVPLPAFEEVTTANLKYDMQDAKFIKERTLGCPQPAEVAKFWSVIPCTSVPEDLSPRSLHSTIGHNTNVWASKNKELQKLEGMTGMIPPNAPASTYFINNTHNVGMGHRDCKSMNPRFQVRHRCRCTNATICGEEERIVAELAAAGKIASNYVL